MIETIKSVLAEFPQANLESKCCREKIAKEIQREFIADLLKRLNIKNLIMEKDKDEME